MAGRSTRSLAFMNVLRWIALVPSVIAAWVVAVFAASIGDSLALRLLCPPDKIVSGFCDVPWWDAVEGGLAVFGASLAAVLVIVAATFVAPSHRPRVVWATYAVGAVLAIAIGRLMPLALAGALVAGSITALVLARVVQNQLVAVQDES